MNEENQVSLSNNDLELIMTISEYCVIHEFERQKIVPKELCTDHYNRLNEKEKLILTNFEVFKGEMTKVLSSIIEKNIENKEK